MTRAKRLILHQHTGIWRYFSRMKMLGKPSVEGKTQGLKLVLHHNLRHGLELPAGRKASPKSPPGAFRTPWGWHRIRATWKRKS